MKSFMYVKISFDKTKHFVMTCGGVLKNLECQISEMKIYLHTN